MSALAVDHMLQPHTRESDDQNVQMAHFWDIYQDEGLGQLAEDVGLFNCMSPTRSQPFMPPIRTRDLKYDNFLKTEAVDPIFMGLKPNSNSSLGLHHTHNPGSDSFGMGGDYGGGPSKLEAPSQQILSRHPSTSPRPHKRRRTGPGAGGLASKPAGTIPFQSSKLQGAAVNLSIKGAKPLQQHQSPAAFSSPPPFNSVQGGGVDSVALQPHVRQERAEAGRADVAGGRGGFAAQVRRFSSSGQASLSPLPLFSATRRQGTATATTTATATAAAAVAAAAVHQSAAMQAAARPQRVSSLAALKAQLEASAREELKNKKKKGGRSSRVQKGLRHFSLKVCEKVELQQVTTYNLVADELVKDLTNPETAGIGNKKVYDEKNIRRRVYDALNVLMAMGIISKDKKQITWIGLPSTVTQDVHSLNQEKLQRLDRIKYKRAQLSDLLTQQVCKKNLAQLNCGAPTSFGGVRQRKAKEAQMNLPFILVNTKRQTVIQCEMSDDRRSLFFDFSNAFSIHEDMDVLRLMKLSRTAPWDLPRMVPREVCSFYPQDDILEPSKAQTIKQQRK